MSMDSGGNQNAVNDKLLAEQKSVSEMKGKYLTFFTDQQLFGVPIADVVQIVGIQTITEVPEFPSYAKGIINLRGSIIPLIDVRLRFGKPECEYNERTCIIVTSISEKAIGFIVDEVDAVTNIDDEKISAPPKISEDQTNTFLTGVATVESKVVLLISTNKLLTEDGLTVLSSGDKKQVELKDHSDGVIGKEQNLLQEEM